MATQLIEHERISTTLVRAKALRYYAERAIALAKKASVNNEYKSIYKLNKILTTEFARKKAMLELATRFKDKQSSFTRIVRLENRRGDNAPMAYIEYLGNEIEKYEKSLKEQKLENGIEKDRKVWEEKIFKQQRDLLAQNLSEAENRTRTEAIEMESLVAQGKISVDEMNRKQRVNQATEDFFKKKLARVEHDLWILNKNKYELIKFPASFY